MADALMEAIVAAPDDDAPRLVWADREGGERGELVVIQCALARQDLPRAERRRLAAREADLLEQNAAAWSGFSRATFVRGFVNGLSIPVDELVAKVENIFANAPFLRDLRIEPLCAKVDPIEGGDARAAWAVAEANLRGILRRIPPGRIRTLGVAAAVEVLPGPFDELSNSGATHRYDEQLLEILTNAPSLDAMRELVLSSSAIGPEHIRAIARLRLERLHLGAHRLTGLDVAHLLRDAPSIERLALRSGHLNDHELALLLSYPEIGRLKELDVSHNRLQRIEDSRRIAECAALANLERLGIAGSDPQGLGLIARSPYLANLRELDVLGIWNASSFLEGATFTDSLRFIRASRADADRLYAMFPALERIESPAKARK